METIKIYVNAKYNSNTRIAKWVYYVVLNNTIYKNEGEAGGIASKVQATLIALGKAIESCDKSYNIEVYSKYSLGVNARNLNNRELIGKIQNMIRVANHKIKFNVIHADDFNFIAVLENKQRQTEDEYYDKLAREEYDKNMMYSDLMGPSQGNWIQRI